MKTRFTEKIDRLPETVEMLANLDTTGLEAALRAGRQRPAVAVGSGGSVISAEFFARCRETLSHGPTLVQTPMDFVLGSAEISDWDVWLFTAGAENPDVVAVARAVASRRPASIHMVTRNPDGLAAKNTSAEGGRVHVVPVAEAKDGYLATHSLVATVGALLMSADRVADEIVGRNLLPRFTNRISSVLALATRAKYRKMFEALEQQDTLIVLADPQLRAVSVLLETSAWETGICAVQNTDFRNFGHGRHSWLHHHGDRSLILALTGRDSRGAWRSLESVFPQTQRQLQVDFDDCGRFANAVGIVKGMVLVEAMGSTIGVDPGKPGIGQFGLAMYESDALQQISASLPSSVRQKRSAMFVHDDRDHSEVSLADAEQKWLRKLGEAVFGGLVFDYDGTIVSTKDRYSPPRAALVEEIERLHRAGLKLGVATGRGGSAGEDLRAVLDDSIHPAVTMGYYNGGYITTLDVDIKRHRPPPDDGIDEAIEWMEMRQDLFRKFERPESGVQISLQRGDLLSPERFALDAQECSAVSDGRVRIDRSGHSFDLVVAHADKLKAVCVVADQLDEGLAVLCIGDSGSRHGNDNTLLSNPYGISVGEVCDMPNGCWSLFGHHLTGPDALLEILRALVPSAAGKFCLDIEALTLDKR